VFNYRIEALRLAEDDTSKKIFADVARICELEDSEKWRNFLAEKKSDKIPHIDNMKKHFIIKDIEYSNVDIMAFKITLVAARKGLIPYRTFGIDVRIKGTNEELVNEIKRDGFIIERHSEIQLRVGDCFVFYYSRNDQGLVQ